MTRKPWASPLEDHGCMMVVPRHNGGAKLSFASDEWEFEVALTKDECEAIARALVGETPKAQVVTSGNEFVWRHEKNRVSIYENGKIKTSIPLTIDGRPNWACSPLPSLQEAIHMLTSKIVEAGEIKPGDVVVYLNGERKVVE